MDLGGKRLRPFLLLASCDLFGGNFEDAIHPAIGIELFHNFTLLHDDLMDQAPLRRGKETVYKKWNPNIAILAGDAMFALANRHMAKTRNEAIPLLIDLFNQTAMEVCEGQQFDMNFETRNDVSLDEYMEMIRLKTAVLIAASLKCGAIIAGARSSVCDQIYNFGIELGLAFQLMDDLLDVYGSEEKFGKISGGDVIAGKKTFLYLKAMEKAADKANDFKSLYSSTTLDAETKINRVKEYFREFEIESITRAAINHSWEKALVSIHSLSLSDQQTRPLLSYCASLMNRDY